MCVRVGVYCLGLSYTVFLFAVCVESESVCVLLVYLLSGLSVFTCQHLFMCMFVFVCMFLCL